MPIRRRKVASAASESLEQGLRNRVDSKRKSRVSRLEWLDAGLEMLKTSGVEAIRVERLADSLSVSKSGFDWHFADREEYLSQLLTYWNDMSNRFVTEHTSLSRGTPRQRLSRIMEIVEGNNLPSFEVAMHAWARNSDEASEAVRSAIGQRAEYVSGIIEQAGFEGEDLEARTDIFVTYVSNRQNYFRFKFEAKRKRLRKAFLDLLLQKSGAGEHSK
jgi:AcrR family transcriptional regulator